jgi:hypothetical protein
MKDTYIRIDGRIRADLLQDFLQGIRELEHRDPDGIHLVVTMGNDDASLREHIGILQKLDPQLPYERILGRNEMTGMQQEALDALYEMFNK